MLDFTELTADGNDLELLTREILFARGYEVHWSGRGPDDGRDLLVTERGDPIFGAKSRTWLVSCKHNAHGGGSVGVGDLAGALEACRAHHAAGFLLVCTTHPSAAAVRRLTDLDDSGRDGVRTHYWDAARLERLLATPQLWAVAQRFMPAATAGWRIWATESPNHYVAAAKGHWFHLTNRHSSNPDFMLETASTQLDVLNSFELPARYKFRLRAIWYDDSHADCVWYIDLLYPRGGRPEVSEEAVARRLWDGKVLDDGQSHRVDVALVDADFGGDKHDDDHHSYYESWMREFSTGLARPKNPFLRARRTVRQPPTTDG
jgi:hypothetical protein